MDSVNAEFDILRVVFPKPWGFKSEIAADVEPSGKNLKAVD